MSVPESAEPLPPPPRRFPWRRFLNVVLTVAVLILAEKGWYLWRDWNRLGDLEPSGGLPFFSRVELPVPLFQQGDPRWREDLLGPTQATLAQEGCALSSACMVLASYGIDTDPGRMNQFLTATDGYTPQGWIYWEKAAELAPKEVRHAYEDKGSYRKIDEQLRASNPVIVKLRLPGGSPHFVVIAGKDGFDYLIRDPGAGGAKGLYPLKELGSKILGLRYYQRL